MSGKQNAAVPDLTRAEALKLARAKWGENARIGWMIDGYRVGFLLTQVPNQGTYWAGQSDLSWREACERAGLLPAEGTP